MDWEHPSWRLDLAFISVPLHIDMERSNKIILACVFHGPCPSDGWTSNNQRAGRGRQSNLTSCLFHQILSNFLPSLSIRWLDQQQSARRTRPAEQLDIMPFPSDSLKFLAFLVHQMTGPATITAPDEASRATCHHAFSIRFSQKLLAFLVHQMTGPATISAPDEAGRATWHHAFSIRFSQISCLPCPSDDWTSNNHRAGQGRQSNLTSCLFHQILSNFLPSLSIRWLDQQQSARRTRPAEQLDIMPFP